MNRARELVVPGDLAGQRLDRVLAQLLPDMTRSALQRLIKDGLVLTDGAPVRASDKPAAGQTIVVGAVTDRDPSGSVTPPTTPRPYAPQPESIPLDIAYEDEHLLVVNKPAKMVVHPARGHGDGTLVNALLAHCRLSAGSGDIRPGIVHRLDRHTSGLLLVAKTEQAHAELARQVEAHEARREYQALVWGRPEPAEGTVRTGFGRHPQHRTMMAVQEWGRGREAITHYRSVESFAWSWTEGAGERPRRRQAALVACVLETGRTHQIRVHMQHLGCPIMRDPVYGDPVRDTEEPAELLALLAALPGQGLHAGRLTFRHPTTGKVLALEAAAPQEFTGVLAWLREEKRRGGGK
ncbi:RluA family pseudouridine synthase [bacterium]|nr:RluA family pseudouridine synthase [bacterium]